MNVVGSKLKLKGFFQGAELGEDGQAGVLGSFVAIQKIDTGEVLNVAISDEAMQSVIAFTYQVSEDPEISPSEPEAEVVQPEPIEEPAPENAPQDDQASPFPQG